jgi:DNA-binding LacI/PurR family transcriptional regulator
MNKINKVTIADIAKQFSVSTTTISNALNGKPGVSSKTREKILQFAKAHDYQPNYFAKGLVANQSFAIGLIVTNFTDPYFPELGLGVQKTLNENGYSMMVFSTNHNIANEKRVIEMLVARGADGIILSTVFEDDPNIDLLNEMQVPYVLTTRIILNPKKSSGIDSVSVDNYGGSYKAAKHLCRLGHKNIAVIAGDMRASTAILRTEGAMAAFADFGITIKPDLFVECGYSQNRAYEAAKDILTKKDRPTAVLAQGDNMALGVREVAYENGLRIPEDLAIIGFDDISLASLAGIEFTTVSQNQFVMGSTGVELLLNKIEEKNKSGRSNNIVLEAELIIRKSCGYAQRGYVK